MSNPYDPYPGQQPPADPAAPTQFVPVQQPQQPAFGAPQDASGGWAQASGQAPYGAQQPAQPYGAPQPGQPYGAAQPAQPYGAPQPGQPYGAPQQQVPAFGAPPQQPGVPGYGAAPQTPYGYPTPVAQGKAGKTGGAKIAGAIFGSIIGRIVVLAVIAGGYGIYHYATSDPAKRDSNGQVNQQGSLGVTDLKVGDCFDLPAGDSGIASVTAIPCTQAHDSQIFAEPKISESSYPGTATLQTEGKTACDSTDAQGSVSSDVPSGVSVEIFFPEESTFNSGTDYFSCALTSDSKNLTQSYVTS